MKTIPRWVPVSEELPEFTRRVPFLSLDLEGVDWHSGWLTDASLMDAADGDDPGRPWWCETCREWFGEVTQWYDLPLPEVGS